MSNTDKPAFGYGVPADPKEGYPSENIEGMTMREYMATHILGSVVDSNSWNELDYVKKSVRLTDLLIEELAKSSNEG